MEKINHPSEDWQHWTEADPAELLAVPYADRQQGNPGRGRVEILDVLCAFDIETARVRNTEQAACYHWQMQFGTCRTIYGRRLEEFRLWMDLAADNIQAGERLIIYVHNLYYEFAFLRGIYPDIEQADVFAVRPRRVLRLRLYDGRVEFRCSYLLTNMSLGQWTKKLGVPHAKLNGEEFDYAAERYPWTPMTAEQVQYCRNDVLGLVEALQVQLSIHGDTLATIPLTSTGYVRRDVKRVMRLWSHEALQKVQPEPDVYMALREAFRGGNTHASRFYSGQIIRDVHSADRSSSYPDVLCNRLFPMGRFTQIRKLLISYVEQLIDRGRAVLFRCRVTNLRLSDVYYPCPYISLSKCIDPETGKPLRASLCDLDNGRVLYAPRAEFCLTDIDYKIIRGQYSYDTIEVLQAWSTNYDYLPDVLRNLICTYYRDKTELKGVAGQELYYQKSKNLLNSIYGMSAQDPCKLDTIYNGIAELGLFGFGDEDIEGKLQRAARQPYTGYQWGVWCTAWARYELQLAIDKAGDNFVYCDTDSVKYVGTLDFTEYNNRCIQASRESGAYATDPAGTVHYMGVYEQEADYTEFVTLGAKKYAYTYGAKLGLTVSGVSRKYGPAELQRAGGLQAFRPGLVFREAGGVAPLYNDAACYDVLIDGHPLHVGPNILLRESTYTLGVTDDYMRLLENPHIFGAAYHLMHVQELARKRTK